MKKSLAAIITASSLALGPLRAQANAGSQATNNQDTLKYNFKAAAKVPLLNLVSLLTGELKYYKNSNEIYGEINHTGELAKIFDRDIKYRTYFTAFYPESIVYIQKENIPKNNILNNDSIKIIRKCFERKSSYFDALTSVSILLNHIEKDSLEHHKLITEGTITLFVDNKIISAKLSSL